MTMVWQNVLVVCIVMGAVVYVAWRVWRSGTSKKRRGCRACSQCLKWWEDADLAPIEPPDAKKEPRR